MSIKDPYDVIEWNPNHHRSRISVLKQEEINERKQKQLVSYVYDLLTFCTLMAALATLLGFLHN